jgi:hypothetical protein
MGSVRKKKSDLTVLEIAQGKLPLTEKQEQSMGDRVLGNMNFKSIHFSQARASQQTEGIPDRKYYSEERGFTFWWEAKASDGKQSKAQAEFEQMAVACGEVYLLGTCDQMCAALAPYLSRASRRGVGVTIPRSGPQG